MIPLPSGLASIVSERRVQLTGLEEDKHKLHNI